MNDVLFPYDVRETPPVTEADAISEAWPESEEFTAALAEAMASENVFMYIYTQ